MHTKMGVVILCTTSYNVPNSGMWHNQLARSLLRSFVIKILFAYYKCEILGHAYSNYIICYSVSGLYYDIKQLVSMDTTVPVVYGSCTADSCTFAIENLLGLKP